MQASDGLGGLSGWKLTAPAFTTLAGSTVDACDRQNLAIQIRDNPKIYLPTTHLVSGVVDNANPHQNIVDTANGGQAMRSSYTDADGTAPGGSTWLDPRVLDCMIQLAGPYTYAVTEIAGGAHGGSSHYDGRAFDVYSINGVTVNSANTYVDGFIQICVNNGARLAWLEPPDYNHIHADWTDNGGNIAPSCTVSIVSASPNPSSVVAGNTFTINAVVNSSQSQPVLLGASLLPAGTTSGYINDPPHDASVTLNSGNNNVSRQFTVPAGTTAGTYDLLFAVRQDSNGNGQIDSGDTLLAITTLSGAVTVTTSDPTPPTATITSPTSSSTYPTSSSTVNLGGSASDNVGVTQVTWSNDRGGSGTASGTTSWSVNSIGLQSGANAITVTAHDAAGNTGSDTLTVTYTALPPKLSNPHLSGTTFTLSVPTQVGFNYTLEYKNAFTDANWTAGQTLAGTGGTITLIDTGATGSRRFYHVRVQ